MFDIEGKNAIGVRGGNCEAQAVMGTLSWVVPLICDSILAVLFITGIVVLIATAVVLPAIRDTRRTLDRFREHREPRGFPVLPLSNSGSNPQRKQNSVHP